MQPSWTQDVCFCGGEIVWILYFNSRNCVWVRDGGRYIPENAINVIQYLLINVLKIYINLLFEEFYPISFIRSSSIFLGKILQVNHWNRTSSYRVIGAHYLSTYIYKNPTELITSFFCQVRLKIEIHHLKFSLYSS